MSMFKVKDLMIKVIPDEGTRTGGNPGDEVGICIFTCQCTFTCWGCSQCSPPSGGNIPGPEERINPADLPALKAHLQERLRVVEALEQSLEPRTAEEFEVLEQKLSAALDEVRHRRRQLASDAKTARDAKD
jgi:hypothetical protein